MTGLGQSVSQSVSRPHPPIGMGLSPLGRLWVAWELSGDSREEEGGVLCETKLQQVAAVNLGPPQKEIQGGGLKPLLPTRWACHTLSIEGRGCQNCSSEGNLSSGEEKRKQASHRTVLPGSKGQRPNVNPEAPVFCFYMCVHNYI